MLTTVAILYIALTSATLIVLLGTIGLFLPHSVERALQKLEFNPVKSFVVGMINLVFWFVILVFWFEWTQYNGGPEMMPFLIGTALGILIIIGLIIPGIPGLVAMARLTGKRWNVSASPLGQDLRGGLLLVLACLVPYVGRYIFTPALLCTAMGAGLLTFFQPRSKTPAVEEKTA